MARKEHRGGLAVDRRRALVALALLALVAFPSGAQEDERGRGDERDESMFRTLVEMVVKQLPAIDARADEARIPDFPSGKEWFNSPPLSFERELRGKIVVLDFWTYCCINCIHVLPDLAWLEKKYAGYPVAFVGVHSAKFDNEKVSENIRNAVLRYEIEHPVINDDGMRLWNALGVRGWPSLAVVGPKGNLVYLRSGEGQREIVDAIITAMLKFYPGDVFRHDPVPQSLERDKGRRTDSPLRFPGKLAIDPGGQRLFISDSNHHRIVVTDLEGRFLEVIGTGRIGLDDGPFDRATFHRLQGLAFDGKRLWVADAENHALRLVDLDRKEVVTLAGDGTQGRDYEGGGSGREQRLSTPWDVAVHGDTVYIAMAGTHQIWVWEVRERRCRNYSGTGSEQNLNSEDPRRAAWAQPSGLTIGGGDLFIADSESSTVRAIRLQSGATRTLVGGSDAEPRNLFVFGDRDGRGDDARLQHPLGVLWLESKRKVLVADTYNHRLKLVDPGERTVVAWAGSGKPGLEDGEGIEARFSEPSGFALGPDGRTVYVADTNNHAVRAVDLESARVRTLELEGVPRPAPAAPPRTVRLADLPGAPTVRSPALRLGPGSEGKIVLRLRLPAGHEYAGGAGSRWQVIADADPPLLIDEARAAGLLGRQDEIVVPFRAVGRAAEETVRLEALAYYCRGKEACLVSGVVFEVPVEVVPGGDGRDVTLEHTFGDMSGNFRKFLLPETEGGGEKRPAEE